MSEIKIVTTYEDGHQTDQIAICDCGGWVWKWDLSEVVAGLLAGLVIFWNVVM